jgi:uncharacterized OB-fold protein
MSAIRIECCGVCGALWSLPRGRCPRCGSGRVKPREVSGRATLRAATLVHRTPDPAFEDRVPFRVGLVDLEEGPRLMGHLAAEAPIGGPLRGEMTEIAGRPVPLFVPVEP